MDGAEGECIGRFNGDFLSSAEAFNGMHQNFGGHPNKTGEVFCSCSEQGEEVSTNARLALKEDVVKGTPLSSAVP